MGGGGWREKACWNGCVPERRLLFLKDPESLVSPRRRHRKKRHRGEGEKHGVFCLANLFVPGAHVETVKKKKHGGHRTRVKSPPPLTGMKVVALPLTLLSQLPTAAPRVLAPLKKF